MLIFKTPHEGNIGGQKDMFLRGCGEKWGIYCVAEILGDKMSSERAKVGEGVRGAGECAFVCA